MCLSFSFLSPLLPPGKYTDTVKAIIPGPNGPRTVTRRIDVRPGDFEPIDLRASGKRPITDFETHLLAYVRSTDCSCVTLGEASDHANRVPKREK
jgi:hypothetical protein